MVGIVGIYVNEPVERRLISRLAADPNCRPMATRHRAISVAPMRAITISAEWLDQAPRKRQAWALCDA